jgi:hypothetical protein
MNADDRKLARAAKRSVMLGRGELAAYRMAGRTIPPKKGKGAGYRRKGKHGASYD